MLFKNVNGTNVEMTPEEEAETLAEWAANENRPQPEAEPTIADIIAILPQQSKDALAANMQLKSAGAISVKQ